MNGLPSSKQCLVIGPYGGDKSKERKWSDWVLLRIVKPVVEENEFGYKAQRTIDDPSAGVITKRIMYELRTADLVVADLTFSNPNAYYELALRHATGKPFIHLAQEGTQMPFDIEVMSVILVGKGKEAQAREELRHQIRNIQAGNEMMFQTDASEPQPRIQARAYDWEIQYSGILADEWLNKQGQAVKEAVLEFNSRGGLPPSDVLRHSLLEYLSFKSFHGVAYKVELYYIIDTDNWHFDGWGIAPATEGRERLTLQVSGYEERKTGSIELRFNQPLAHQKIGGLEGDIGPFRFSFKLKASQQRPREFEGVFCHPLYPDVPVGTCSLRPKTG